MGQSVKKWPFFGYFRHFCSQILRNRKGLEFFFCVFRRFPTPSRHKSTTPFYSTSNLPANHDICGLMCGKMGRNGGKWPFSMFSPLCDATFLKAEKKFFAQNLFFDMSYPNFFFYNKIFVLFIGDR